MDYSAQISDLNRRLANLIRDGLIAEVDHSGAVCRVDTGDITTDWLPWYTVAAGNTRRWDPPTVGEQVTIFSPSGELAAGRVMRGLYTDDQSAPSEDPAEHMTTYPDGCVVHYNHETSTLEATGLKVAHLQASESVTVDTRAAIVNASESATVKTKVATVTASESATVQTKTATIDASECATIKSMLVTIDAPTTNVTGVMNVAGVVTCAGLAAKGGAAGAAVTIIGDVEITGTLKNNNINLSTHRHNDAEGRSTGAPS